MKTVTQVTMWRSDYDLSWRVCALVVVNVVSILGDKQYLEKVVTKHDTFTEASLHVAENYTGGPRRV